MPVGKASKLDTQKLKRLETDFLMRYPGGFDDPDMLAITKKHNFDKMVAFSHAAFDKVACSNIHVTADNMVKAISRSSMISMYEKPKFRDFVKNLNEYDKAFLVDALSNMLHGKQQFGFEAMVDILRTEKLAKWSLVSLIPAYYAPQKQVFVKPTTAKNILKHFELDDPAYKPAPTWDFYKKYRQLMIAGKSEVNKSLSPSNVAFTRFLIMTVDR
ncbi:MAG: hypothetical protein ACJA1S_002035 [Cellvibrionaceae bacterium]|jgi:hypothetical protein